MFLQVPSRHSRGLFCAAILLSLCLTPQPASATASQPTAEAVTPDCAIAAPDGAAFTPDRAAVSPKCQAPTGDDSSSDVFTVVLNDPVNSKTARKGDAVLAVLGSQLDIEGHHFTPGATVVGHITNVAKARCNLRADIFPKRWLQADGALGLQFDQVADDSTTAEISGLPIPMPKEFREAVQEKSIAVSKSGMVSPSRKSDIAPKLARTAIGTAGTLLHCPLVPLIGGCVGAIAPSLVLESSDKEYQSELKHRRLKGFATGAIAGMPGGFLINETLLKGRDEVVKPGTVLLVRLQGSTAQAAKLPTLRNARTVANPKRLNPMAI